jgi:4-alpha-glucanotransferase
VDPIYELATLYGVHTAFHEISGQERTASPDALLQVLRALGASLARVADAATALRERRQILAQRCLEPVHVAWNGNPTELSLQLAAAEAGSTLRCRLKLESGEERSWSCAVTSLPQAAENEVEGVRYQTRKLAVPGPLPWGYHQLTLERGEAIAHTLLLSAPVAAYQPQEGPQARTWGVFLPLYALHSERSWGAGDLTDLEALIEWATGLGGGMVATLPLLAQFLDEPFEPGPYSPASRLFWNEFYLDVARIPELQSCPAAQALLASADLERAISDLRSAPLIDYHRQMGLKRRILEELSRSFFSRSNARMEAFRRFLQDRPSAEDYARFRAVGERRRAPWPTWPAPLRDGVVADNDYDEAAQRYHLYVQWLADEQLQALAAKAKSAGPGFYLDLPLGVNPDSYDVWREREAFATGIAAGAPPDPFFAKGQNWGFPPLHPQRIREQGYRYVIAYLRHHLRLAGVLRIDHLMGFHRLFWVPQGLEARQGVYVQYPSEELYAVFSLESHRHRALLVGEDLGTVPPEVRPDMARHNVRRMYVLQFELQPNEHNAINPVHAGCVASINTHDTPPFAAFWQALDIQDRVELGTLDPSAANGERGEREKLINALVRNLQNQGRLQGRDPAAVLKACLLYLGASSAQVVLANLEDLWLETQPQNVPGTWRERPNWRRKARHTLEAIRQMPVVTDTLRELDRLVHDANK